MADRHHRDQPMTAGKAFKRAVPFALPAAALIAVGTELLTRDPILKPVAGVLDGIRSGAGLMPAMDPAKLAAVPYSYVLVSNGLVLLIVVAGTVIALALQRRRHPADRVVLTGLLAGLFLMSFLWMRFLFFDKYDDGGGLVTAVVGSPAVFAVTSLTGLFYDMLLPPRRRAP